MKLKQEFIKLSQERRLHQCHRPIIGITGGIACGKSTVVSILEKEKNIQVIKADLLIKDIYTYEKALIQIKSIVPDVFTNSSINFPKLREISFNQPSILRSLEDILYPFLPQAFNSAAEKIEKQPVLFYEIPLLFEKKLQDQFDLILCVSSNEKIQLERIILRDNCTKETAKNIISQQISLKEKEKFSDFVLKNDGDIHTIRLQLNNFLEIFFKEL